MNLWIANPRGFCAGVDRAVKIVDELIDLVGAPVYVRHEIVHNHHVVERLRGKGAVFVDDLASVPRGALAVISAHGAAPGVQAQARTLGLRLFDATCPLVSKVHLEVVRHARAGRRVIVIGHRDHVEVIGTVGHYANPEGDGIAVVENEDEARQVGVPRPDHVAYVTQTTLAVETSARIVAVLRGRFPALIAPHHEDICYATQNRQDAVRRLSGRCSHVYVLGAPHSSNSVRLVEVAQESGAQARLIERADDIDRDWFASARHLGLTSSASAPECLVSEAIARLQQLVPTLAVREVGVPEQVVFKLPAAVADLRRVERPAVDASAVQTASASF